LYDIISPKGGVYIMNKIGENIAKKRKEFGWTQEELAIKMGYKSKSTINKIELGINDIPQSKVAKFAEVLKTTPAYIMGWEEEQKKNDAMTDIVIRMRSNENFREAVSYLYNLDDEKLESVKQLLITFQK